MLCVFCFFIGHVGSLEPLICNQWKTQVVDFQSQTGDSGRTVESSTLKLACHKNSRIFLVMEKVTKILIGTERKNEN